MNLTETPLASRFLGAFTALFIILGIGYSTLTPIFENSDETLHYPYVKHLADGQGFPLATPGQLWNQEGTQHPLYYTIVAASTFWIDTNNFLDHLQRNPHWLFTEVRALINDNQNLVLHGPMDAFPYRRAALAVHIGRWWSLTFGLIAVVGTFLIGRHLFPNNLPLTLTATTLTAFNPQFIRVSTTVSNDSLSAALTTLTVFLALKFTDPQSPTYKTFGDRPAALLGLFTSLALLTKLSSLTTLLLVSFIIFWRLFFLGQIHESPFRKLIRWLVIIGAITVASTGWWFLRNYQLYGEWLATETHLNLAGRSRLTLVEIWKLRAEVERAYWATLGWGQIRPPEWVFRLLAWLTRLGLIGLSLALLAKIIQGTKRRPLPLNLTDIDFEKIIILLFWAALNVALYVRWVMDVGSVSHTRLIFPAITAVSLLLALGWHALIPRPLAWGLSGAVTTLLLALNIYSLGWLIYPAFTPFTRLAGQNSKTENIEASPLELTFLDRLKLVEGQVYPQSQRPLSAGANVHASQGDVIMVSASWQVLAPLHKNYSVAAVLLSPGGNVLARRDTYPGLGLRPTRYLRPGDTFTDLYPLRLDNDVPEAIVAHAVVGLFDFDTEARVGLPALDGSGNEVTPIVGQIKIVPKTWPSYEPAYTTQVNFAGAISLIGYDFAAQSKIPWTARQGWQNPLDGPSGLAKSPGRPVRAGKIEITLYWQSLAPVSEDYVLFLHLLDAKGQVIAQADAPPTHNAYPTSWWAPAEIIADRHALPTTTPEAVTLRLGLYQLDSGQRLPIIESTLSDQDNGVEIALP